jgi:hypothetical protein
MMSARDASVRVVNGALMSSLFILTPARLVEIRSIDAPAAEPPVEKHLEVDASASDHLRLTKARTTSVTPLTPMSRLSDLFALLSYVC